MTAVIVPVKPFGAAKTRLEGALPPETREALAVELLRHVLSVTAGTEGVTDVAVTSSDGAVAGIAFEAGARFLPEPGEGMSLNEAVAHAMQAMDARGVVSVLVVVADLPLLRAAELEEAVEAVQSDVRRVVLARSARGGTALVGRGTAVRIPRLVFGGQSFEAFRQVFAEAGITVREIAAPGFLTDLDEPEDIPGVLASPECAPGVRRLLEPLSGPASQLRDVTPALPGPGP